MRVTLSLALKIFALFFWWYGVVFVVSIAPLLGFPVSEEFIPEYRGDVYAWDFELLFTSIFIVWGWFLWVASRAPEKHTFFINFTVAATIAHIMSMLIIGFVRSEDLWHMLKDAIALAIPVVLVLHTRGTNARFSAK